MDSGVCVVPYSTDAQTAWDRATGAGQRIAILDTDFDLSQEDLTGRVAWSADIVDHPAYSDEDAYIVWMGEYEYSRIVLKPTGDWWDHDTNLQNEDAHGTRVATTAAAHTDNSNGIAGMARGASLILIRVVGTYGLVYQEWDDQHAVWNDVSVENDFGNRIRYSDLINAIEEVSDKSEHPSNFANVINMSFQLEGSYNILDDPDDLSLLQDAISYATLKGITCVSGVKNRFEQITGPPASLDGVIAVGATDIDNNAHFSAYGQYLDIVAPGIEIPTGVPQHVAPVDTLAQRLNVSRRINAMDSGQIQSWDGYDMDSGSSFAAPLVAGAAAMLREYIGGNVWSSVIEKHLQRSAETTADPNYDGHGRLNVNLALDHATIEEFTATEEEPLAKLLVADKPTENYVSLTWEDYASKMPETTHYLIERKIGGGDWGSLDRIDADYHSYDDEDIYPGQQYSYRIYAVVWVPSPPTGFPELGTTRIGISEVQTLTTSGEGELLLPPSSSPGAPGELTLGSASPNPFNPTTSIRFGLSVATEVRLRVFNTRGQLVQTLIEATRTPGWYQVTWDGKDERGREVATGIYLYVLEAEGKRLIRKMTLIR